VRDHYPLAYHITFGTYGTRLHGDERGTVDRRANQPGEAIVGAEPEWEWLEYNKLRFPPREFDVSQRRLVEQLIPDICTHGGWRLHACAAGKDHVHTLLTAEADGDVIRKLLKRWLGQSLAAYIMLLDPEQTFWAECGSVKWVWTDEYFARVTKYICDQRATR
jgi:REP element-mobilizing transposase RayT